MNAAAMPGSVACATASETSRRSIAKTPDRAGGDPDAAPSITAWCCSHLQSNTPPPPPPPPPPCRASLRRIARW